MKRKIVQIYIQCFIVFVLLMGELSEKKKRADGNFQRSYSRSSYIRRAMITCLSKEIRINVKKENRK